MSEPGPVCGIQDIYNASNESLKRLLDQIGRHDQLGEPECPQAEKVRQVLADRRAQGICIDAEGQLHHPV